MLKTIIKIISILWILYINLLYWLDDKYSELQRPDIEGPIYYNAFYFGALILCFGFDLKKSTVLRTYVNAGIFAILGLLMPTELGRIVGLGFTSIALFLYAFEFFRTRGSETKTKDT